MNNIENMKVTEEFTVFDEASSSVINNRGDEAEVKGTQVVVDSVKSMMLSSSIVDTNCKEIGMKNIETQYDFAKLACEHPESAEIIKSLADNASAADERATRRFEKWNDTVVKFSENAIGICLMCFTVYACHKGWIEFPEFPIGRK